MISLLISLSLVAIIIWLTYRLRTVNRKLAHFFNALENNDYSLKLIESRGTSSEKLLNRSLNRLKTIIQNTRIEIRQKEKYYELILSSINTGVIALNSKGFIIQSNRFALKLLGLEIFTHVNQLQKVSHQLQETFMKIKPGENRQVTFTKERGRVQLLINATDITIRNEKITLLVINDIENEMDEKEIDSWVRLIRVLSHEIMNSIAPITSLSDTLLTLHQSETSHNTIPSSIRDNTINGLQVISETGKSLISFVESYRKFTRIPEPQKEMIDLEEFINRMIILCSTEPHFEAIRIQTTIQPDHLKIYADPNLFGQVLLNIMKNAIQAMHNQVGGQLHIHAQQIENSAINLKITDNGPGIPPEIINEIFVPFYTTKENGSGIGLSVARQIMRAHGGNIKVSSIEGQATTFTITL